MANVIFKCILFKGNCSILIFMNFILRGTIDNKPALIQIYWAGKKPDGDFSNSFLS